MSLWSTVPQHKHLLIIQSVLDVGLEGLFVEPHGGDDGAGGPVDHGVGQQVVQGELHKDRKKKGPISSSDNRKNAASEMLLHCLYSDLQQLFTDRLFHL